MPLAGDFDMKSTQLEKVRAEIRKPSAGSDQLMMETRWYPLVLATALMAAVPDLVRLLS
jgi:hypothetical protein